MAAYCPIKLPTNTMTRETMKSISHAKAYKIEIPIAELFPLFSPEGEKRWVPGWDYENLMGTTELSVTNLVIQLF